MEKKYWQSINAYKAQPEQSLFEKQPKKEFTVEGLDESEVKGKSSRRDFLKSLGFSVGAVALVSSCQMPVRKAIPFLNQPEEIIPGVANYYASTFYDGHDYCSILVKNREGRPIKIEGNELSKLSKGGTNARVQASVLNLYDDARLKNPMKDGQNTDWETVDREIVTKLNALKGREGSVAIVTGTVISPSTTALIKEFVAAQPGTEWVMYDAHAHDAIRKAHLAQTGEGIIPFYQFDKAETIVSFGADFLGTWLMPVTFTKQFNTNRKLDKDKQNMSKLFVVESNLSLTGSNADERYTIKPLEEAAVLLDLYNKLAARSGQATYSGPASPIDTSEIADELFNARGKSLVVCGTNKLENQLIVNAINYILGNYENTLNTQQPMMLSQGSDEKMLSLVQKMNAGQIGMLMCWNVNPVYDHPQAEQFIEGLKKVDAVVSFADRMDETASLSTYVCPDNNYLESWDDAEAVRGYYSIMQPAIRNIFNTRQAQDSLLKWMGSEQEFSAYMEQYWENEIFPGQSAFAGFRPFWTQAKHDGLFDMEVESKDFVFTPVALKVEKPSEVDGFELVVYEKVAIGTGKYTNNPWLMELPDPVTTATWDNYLTISMADAESHGLLQEDVVRFGHGLELPVLVQAGQAKGTLGMAMGFGRSGAGPVANGIGVNAFGLMQINKGLKVANQAGITLEKTAKKYQLALTQSQHTMEGRNVVKETTLAAFLQDPASGNEDQKYKEKVAATLYPEAKFDGFHWGLAVDLNSCTGCGNCVISCQAENNVSVVGKDEVRRNRIMHWIRIDRYYSEDADNPKVYHQPVMCQHCDNAPCENVCPVAATNHSSEGLNQMAYNRCIGTKYCMNNCPYRVRRFNWFAYINNPKFNFNKNSDLGKMVLNPDVTVRERGVVEKCSFCVQRIQDKKLNAKKENRKLEDLEIKTACMQSCPGDALVFGNMNDPESKVSLLMKSKRRYRLVEELHTLPSVSYLTKVRNTSKA